MLLSDKFNEVLKIILQNLLKLNSYVLYRLVRNEVIFKKKKTNKQNKTKYNRMLNLIFPPKSCNVQSSH